MWNANLSDEDSKKIREIPNFRRGTEIKINYNLSQKTLTFKIDNYSITLNEVLPDKGYSLVPCAIFLNVGDSINFNIA
jgi:hypothetical protein